MNHKKHFKFIIIGAGPTGLGAGYRLSELGEDNFLIIDSADRVGGLSASYQDKSGFTWDIGGHIQFSHYTYFDHLMDLALGKDGWIHHERESWVWIADRFVPYPFQNNLRYLPKELTWKCVDGLVKVYQDSRNPECQNFKQWIQATFGSGIAEVFMEPYNFKVWAYPLNEMSFNWIGERVAVTNLSRVFENIFFEKDDVSWGPNNTFRFPKEGGTGSIWKAVANLIGYEKIRLNSTVSSISRTKHTLNLETGEEFTFDYLFNTMPLSNLIEKVSEAPNDAKNLSKQLRFSSSNIVGIGLMGSPPNSLNKKCWMYFPENNCPFYRVTVFSNYSPKNVPNSQKCWSLMAEVSESPFKPINQENLINDVIRGFQATKLIDSSHEIISQWKYRAPHGYPTPFLNRDMVLGKLHQELEPFSIFSRGRFGGWKYEVSNQDHSLMQGVEWANRIVCGIPETTYFFPQVANSGWGKLS